MARVPTDRYGHFKALRTGRKKAIIVAGVPIPADADRPLVPPGQLGGLHLVDEWDKIDCQAELMRGLERSRFRRPDGEQCLLPFGLAVCLEDFEAGLRAAGLVAVDQVLVQSLDTPRKFVVQKGNVSMDGHSGSSVEAGAPPHGAHYLPSMEFPSERFDRRVPVKAEERQRALTGKRAEPPPTWSEYQGALEAVAKRRRGL